MNKCGLVRLKTYKLWLSGKGGNKKMTRDKLTEILESHKLWLSGKGGKMADLSGANLREANLSGADMSRADLRDASMRGAYLRGANLSRADLSGANLHGANLSMADLSGANLHGANLSRADLSGAKGLMQTTAFIAENFERTSDGYIAYKTFNSQYRAPDAWEIKHGSIIAETVNFDRCTECGSGINVAPLKWVQEHQKGEIWKVLIRWEWMCGVCIPYNTDGKIRCERVELVGIVGEGEQ